PPSIAPMVRRQALELSPHRFKSDTERLLDVIERSLDDLQEAAAEETPEPETAAVIEPAPVARPPRRRLLSACAALAALVVAGTVLPLSLMDDDDPGTAATQDPKPSASATAPPKLGGKNAPVVLAHRGGDEQFAWNTIPAFEHAASIGVAVETDVRWSKDG